MSLCLIERAFHELSAINCWQVTPIVLGKGAKWPQGDVFLLSRLTQVSHQAACNPLIFTLAYVAHIVVTLIKHKMGWTRLLPFPRVNFRSGFKKVWIICGMVSGRCWLTVTQSEQSSRVGQEQTSVHSILAIKYENSYTDNWRPVSESFPSYSRGNFNQPQLATWSSSLSLTMGTKPLNCDIISTALRGIPIEFPPVRRDAQLRRVANNTQKYSLISSSD